MTILMLTNKYKSVNVGHLEDLLIPLFDFSLAVGLPDFPYRGASQKGGFLGLSPGPALRWVRLQQSFEEIQDLRGDLFALRSLPGIPDNFTIKHPLCLKAKGEIAEDNVIGNHSERVQVTGVEGEAEFPFLHVLAEKLRCHVPQSATLIIEMAFICESRQPKVSQHPSGI